MTLRAIELGEFGTRLAPARNALRCTIEKRRVRADTA